MNATLITTLLALFQQLAGGGATTSLIAKIIAILTDLVPIIIKEYQDLMPIVRNIIVALKSDPSTTAAQLEQLQVQEAQWDAEFEAAATAALAEDAAAAGTS